MFFEIIFQEYEVELQECGEFEEKLEIEDFLGFVGVFRKCCGVVSVGFIIEDEVMFYVKKVI